MNPNLSITKKTYYALGMVGVACGMTSALSALVLGQSMAALDSVSFGLIGMMLLLLAAVKGQPGKLKSRYFLCFVLLLLSMLNQNPLIHALLGAGVWPLLMHTEAGVGPDLGGQLKAVAFSEAAYLAAWLLASSPLTALQIAANLLGFVRLVARAWASYSLYRAQLADPDR